MITMLSALENQEVQHAGMEPKGKFFRQHRTLKNGIGIIIYAQER